MYMAGAGFTTEHKKIYHKDAKVPQRLGIHVTFICFNRFSSKFFFAKQNTLRKMAYKWHKARKLKH